MIEVKSNLKNGSGFDVLHSYDGWKIAFITFAEQYNELKTVKRHTQTDEAFILVKGKATLYSSDGDEPLEATVLEKEKLYIVKMDTWHHLQISEDALLVVVENSDTTKDNTESKEIKKEQTK